MQDDKEKEEPKDAKHIDHDTADAVLDLMQEFHIKGDELEEPNKAKADSETSSE